MLKMLSNASYTFPAMQDATTLLHSQSQSYASYGDLKEGRPNPLSQSHSFSHSVSTTDEEMTSVSGDSEGDSFGETDTTPETSLGEEEKIQEDKVNAVQEDNDDAVSNKPVVEDEAMDRMDEDRKGKQDEADELDLQPKLSEWERQGGMVDINAAFEGTMIFDATLEEISAWCAPLVWKLFLRQEPACSKSNLHRYHLALDTPMPPTLPKLLTKAMPRYKGGMTRSIAVTHALLYLHRINVCFHCNGTSRDAIASSSSNGNGNFNTNSNSNTKGSLGKSNDLRSRIERNFQSTGEENRVSDNAFQCSLFFAVGMHFASLWLLDCCPADIKYWKNYVHCVPAAHGIPWFRLVLRQWGYNITVSIDEWLFFSAQVLSKVPFRDEESRARQNQLGQSPQVQIPQGQVPQVFA